MIEQSYILCIAAVNKCIKNNCNNSIIVIIVKKMTDVLIILKYMDGDLLLQVMFDIKMLRIFTYDSYKKKTKYSLGISTTLITRAKLKTPNYKPLYCTIL